MKPLSLGLCLALAACGGSSAAPSNPSAAAAPTPVSESAPGWARGPDSTTDDSYQFICQGEGSSEDDALSTASALCDDKICKLCGVEVESIVQTKETLTGVDLQRKVIERCRRVRLEDVPVVRKSVDCGPQGCEAWIQVEYKKALRDVECKRLTDDNFADPNACQDTIEAFKNVPGFGSDSFRQRVQLIDDAILQCAQIDVRPTPLMTALDEKLKVGMRVWMGRPTPSYLLKSHLAGYAPLDQQVKETNTFIGRMKLYRGYLASKVPLMVMHESLDPDDIDSPQAIERIRSSMADVPALEHYGVKDAHMVAISSVRYRISSGKLLTNTDPIGELFRELYPPDRCPNRHEVALFFAQDDRLTPAEWDYLWQTGDKVSAYRVALGARDHGSAATRLKRFDDALARELSTAKPDQRRRVLKRVLPKDGAFVLEVEKRLPKDLRYDYTFLKDMYSDRGISYAAHERYLTRMVELLGVLPSDTGPKGGEARQFCLRLSDALSRLTDQGADVAAAVPSICACLEGPLREETLSLGNKSELYRRALRRRLKCVQARSRS